MTEIESPSASQGAIDRAFGGSVAVVRAERRPFSDVVVRAQRKTVELLAYHRVQFLGALLVGVLIPALFRWSNEGLVPLGAIPDLNSQAFWNSVAGSLVAIALGALTIRQLKTHPGVNSIGYVFYAFVMTYGALGAALLLFRGGYARYQLVLSFILTVSWFFLVQSVLNRHSVMRLAFIPSAGTENLPSRVNLKWIRLETPDCDFDDFDGVVTDHRAEHTEAWERMIARCALAGVPVFEAKRVSEQITGRVRIGQLADNTLGATLHGLVYAKLKRGVDFIAAIYLLPGVLLALGVAAIAIKLDDGGPILFRQTRMGYRGLPFTIYKLRTMSVNAGGEHFTTDRDPRITRIGGFLRKYRVDELPQVLNILLGQMSWIGPRPEAVSLADWYEAEVPYYSYRHMVRPGITGWAQVNQGNVAKLPATNEKLQYDFYYIKNLSPWLDLLIVAKTIQTILTGFGSK